MDYVGLTGSHVTSREVKTRWGGDTRKSFAGLEQEADKKQKVHKKIFFVI